MPDAEGRYTADDIIPCSDPSCACAERRRVEIERTEVARRDFAAKMKDWRESGGIPGYNGPRATRD